MNNTSLSGTQGNDYLEAEDSNDNILGNGEDNTLKPGWGEDVVDGGAGTDTLVIDYSTLPTAAVIWDKTDYSSSDNGQRLVGNAYGMNAPKLNLGSADIDSIPAAISADGTTVGWDSKVRKLKGNNKPLKIGGNDISLSADGSRIAYTNDGNLYVSNADSSDAIQLFDREVEKEYAKSLGYELSYSGSGIQSHMISADGSKVVWQVTWGYPDTKSSIVVANSDGTGLTRSPLYSDKHYYGADIFLPFISGDGSTIAWIEDEELRLSNSDFSEIETLDFVSGIGINEHSNSFALSADGSTIAWYDENANRVWVAPTDGSRSDRIDASGYVEDLTTVSLSPDGKRVSYISSNNNGLFVANSDGTGEPTLIDSGSIHELRNYRQGLSSYVDIGVRYGDFDVATGSGEILTWGPSHVNFSNVEKFVLKGTIYDDELFGGDLDDTLQGNSGDDRIITGLGNDIVDGGEGIDTVVYEDVVYQGNNNLTLSKTANTVNYNNTDSLTNIEYIQFADVKVSAETLPTTPELAISNKTLLEGSTDSYTFKLNVTAPTDVVFDYSTVDGTAVAGSDYIATSDTITIPAGETTAKLKVKALKDSLYDEAKESLGINITGLTGATLNDNSTESVIPVYIKNKKRDKPITRIGGLGNNVLNGGLGHDNLDGNDGNDTLRGNDGDDTLKGSRGRDKLFGQNEDDNLIGAEGNDTLDGGAGNDFLKETADVNFTLKDTQLTGLGTDKIRDIEYVRLQGGADDNKIDASQVSELNVTLVGGAGNDSLYGGAKADVLSGQDGSDRLVGSAGNDSLIGGNGNDGIFAGAGNDSLDGGNGDDILRGETGNDSLDGGAGNDKIIEKGDVNFSLTDTQLTGLGTDTLRNIELARIQGGASNNMIDASDANNIETVILGEAGNDILMGSQMGDTIYGGIGGDLLSGEMGEDLLVGNGGADIFALESSMGTDTVKDFQNGIDRFGLFNALGFGDLSITNNVGGTAALIADTTNNNQLLAVVNNIDAVDLTAADFTTI